MLLVYFDYETKSETPSDIFLLAIVLWFKTKLKAIPTCLLGAKRENDFCNKIRRSEVIVYSRHIRSISRKFFHPIWGLIYLKKIYLKEGRTLALALAISKYTKSDKPSHHFTWWWGEWLSVHQQCRDAQWTIFTKKQFTAKFSHKNI